jgi:hypothetical protein
LHNVKVDTTQSKLLSGAEISSPRSGTYSTGKLAAAMRFLASLALPREGSTATTRSTPGGYHGRLVQWLKVPDPELDFFTFEEAERLVGGAPGDWKAMIVVGLRTGHHRHAQERPLPDDDSSTADLVNIEGPHLRPALIAQLKRCAHEPTCGSGSKTPRSIACPSFSGEPRSSSSALASSGASSSPSGLPHARA